MTCAWRRRAGSALLAGALALLPTVGAAADAVQASELIGMEVRIPGSDESGRIEDLVVDLAHNRVHYAVLELPGRVLTQPLAALEFAADRAVLAAGGGREIAPRPGMALARASELIGWEIESEPGIDVGRIAELVVDPASGAIPFAVVRLQEDADHRSGGKPLRAVPLEAFEMHALRENLVLTLDASALESAGGFSRLALQEEGFVRRQARLAEALTGASGASAGGSTRGRAGTFERLDRNGDGFLVDAELDRPIAERRNWLAIDLDRDGRISRDEFSAMRGG